MSTGPVWIDISDLPELARIAQTVRDSEMPCILRQGEEALAIVVPVPRRKKRRGAWSPGKEDLEAALSSAGAWSDMDTDTLIANIYADRDASNKPPLVL